MRTVKPIELADDRFEAVTQDVIENGTAAEVVEQFLERQLDEIDALVSLLGMARKLPTGHERFGYDCDYLDEIVMRRVRKLVRACQDTVSAIVDDDPENPPEAEDFGPFED